jgi:hypothetical protein
MKKNGGPKSRETVPLRKNNSKCKIRLKLLFRFRLSLSNQNISLFEHKMVFLLIIPCF